ncbi:hypothetical protein PR048_027816 [Dryococelus australis]|uniref:Uncharacterized protein n=1 Tax=Dryococelus australis TaxID=614101 RepID=A0ABQ9GHL5_9NEOP|nr:hypothetical protein PR048_027816 [Dryococelus australis]
MSRDVVESPPLHSFNFPYLPHFTPVSFTCHLSTNTERFYLCASAIVAEWLDCSPTTLEKCARFPAGSLPDFCTWESCWTMPLDGGIFRGSPTSTAHALRCFMHTSLHPHRLSRPLTLKASQISPLNLSHSFTCSIDGIFLKIQSGAVLYLKLLFHLYSLAVRSVMVVCVNRRQRVSSVRKLDSGSYILSSRRDGPTCPSVPTALSPPYSPTSARRLTSPTSSVAAISLASHVGEPGLIPCVVPSGFSHVGIILDDAADRWVFSGISRFPAFSFNLCSISTSFHPFKDYIPVIKTIYQAGYSISMVALVVAFTILVSNKKYDDDDDDDGDGDSVGDGDGEDDDCDDGMIMMIVVMIVNFNFKSCSNGATATERLDYSPPTTVNQRIGFSQLGILPDDATGLRFFSGISCFPRPLIPALLHTYLTSPDTNLFTHLYLVLND